LIDFFFDFFASHTMQPIRNNFSLCCSKSTNSADSYNYVP